MPEFLGWPVSTPADWQRLKPRFNPATAERWGGAWKTQVARCKDGASPVRWYGIVADYFGGPSLFGFVRMLLGDEAVLFAFYDYPKMVHDMMETMTEFTLAMLSRTLRDVCPNEVQFWEDMCYRGGPLISPELVREFMVPCYRRITASVRSMGIDSIWLDCDGNVEKLLPLWLDAGITGIFPMEQAAGNDLRLYRQIYGRMLRMSGGIDKRALASGPAAIDAELAAKLPLAEGGGYIPTLDHAIPPNVSYSNFMYYWKRKKELLGVR